MIGRNRCARNLAMLVVLVGFVALIYAVTIVRLGGG